MKNFKTITKFSVIVFILIINLLHTTDAFPSVHSGRKLILHTPHSRQQMYEQLLTEEISKPPTTQKLHHHHMHLRSVRNHNMPKDNIFHNNECGENNRIEINLDLCGLLSRALVQANTTYANTRLNLRIYTESQFRNKTPEDIHTELKNHHFHLEHPFKDRLNLDFDVVPADSNFTHLHGKLNTKDLRKEWMDMYNTLQMFNEEFKELNDSRTSNASLLKHNLDYNEKYYNAINEFFLQEHKYIGYDIAEVEDLLRCKPAYTKPASKNDIHTQPIRDWLLVREHLAFAQYMRKSLKIVLESCRNQLQGNIQQ